MRREERKDEMRDEKEMREEKEEMRREERKDEMRDEKERRERKGRKKKCLVCFCVYLSMSESARVRESARQSERE